MIVARPGLIRRVTLAGLAVTSGRRVGPRLFVVPGARQAPPAHHQLPSAPRAQQTAACHVKARPG